MATNSDKLLNTIIWVLKIGVFGIFLGHGLYAIQVKMAWIPFLENIGFSNDQAVQIMPYIGYLDILIAISVLFKPLRAVLLWAIFWAFLTALMRPLTGGSIIDFIERAGNWVTPLALLLLLKWKDK